MSLILKSAAYPLRLALCIALTVVAVHRMAPAEPSVTSVPVAAPDREPLVARYPATVPGMAAADTQSRNSGKPNPAHSCLCLFEADRLSAARGVHIGINQTIPDAGSE